MDMVCAPLAFIDGLGGPEMMLVFVIVLLLFGGQKLPEFARGLGKTMREFKKAASGVEEEFKRALEEDERKKNAVATPYTATPALPASTATDPHQYDSDAHAYDHNHPDHYSDGGPYAPSSNPPAAATDGSTQATPSPTGTEPATVAANSDASVTPAADNTAPTPPATPADPTALPATEEKKKASTPATDHPIA